MTAVQKTKSNEYKTVPLDALQPNPKNPNKMSGRAFDLLVDNMEQTGLTEPILVRPLKQKGQYRIVGGHHRYEAARYLGFEEVPVVVITDPDFDEEAETFQMVRMNVIKGKLDPQAFVDIYNQVAGKYGDDLLQEMFGFAEEKEFKALIDAAAKQLPKDMQKEFKEAAKELRTIDDLAKLLNRMFSVYGDSLPFGYMVLDYGGKDSVWLRLENKKSFDAVLSVCQLCRQKSRTVDDVVGGLMQLIAKGELDEVVARIVETTPQVEIEMAESMVPTKDQIEMVKSL